MRKHHLSLLMSLGVGLAAAWSGWGCSVTKHDAVPVVELPAPSFGREWMGDLELKRDAVSKLFVRDDFIFVYTENNFVYAFARASGELKFAIQVGVRPDELLPPVVLRDFVVIPTPAIMYVFNKEGRALRTLPVEYSMHGDVVGYGSRIYYGGDAEDGGRVLCIDLAKNTGSQVPAFQYFTRGPVSSTPALFQDLLYAAAEDGTAAAVNDEGKATWPLPKGLFTTPTAVKADLKADEFGVYIASTDSKLYCVDRLTGKIRWQYFSGQPLDTSPAVSPTTVYEVVPGKGMVAIDKLSGAYNRVPKWTIANAVRFLAEDHDNSYLLRRDNVIIAVDKAAGEVKFRSDRTDLVAFGENTNSMDKMGGIIYAATRDGHVFAIMPVLKPGTVGQVVLGRRTLDTLASISW